MSAVSGPSAQATPSPAPMTGAELIAAERRRQQEVEGWSIRHDVMDHRPGDLIAAARCYAVAGGPEAPLPSAWPWEWNWWKPKDRLRNLVRAGALIEAERDVLGHAIVADHGADGRAYPVAEMAQADRQSLADERDQIAGQIDALLAAAPSPVPSSDEELTSAELRRQLTPAELSDHLDYLVSVLTHGDAPYNPDLLELCGIAEEIRDRSAAREAEVRRDRSALVQAATRALAVLDLFIDDHPDPGSEALGARYEMSVALHPFGSQEHIHAAEDQVRRDERRKIVADVRAHAERDRALGQTVVADIASNIADTMDLS